MPRLGYLDKNDELIDSIAKDNPCSNICNRCAMEEKNRGFLGDGLLDPMQV
jgi:hypothetical protein